MAPDLIPAYILRLSIITGRFIPTGDFMELSSFVYRQLNPTDKLLVDGFIKEQLSAIPKDHFYPPNSTILEKALSKEDGLSQGVFDGEQLIGIRLTYKPGISKYNHGYDLGYPESDLIQVAQFHGTLIAAGKRYNGIGSELIRINCEEIFKKKFSIILATAHPDNFPSIKMLLSNNFTQKLLTKKYNDLPRLIFEKLKKSISE